MSAGSTHVTVLLDEAVDSLAIKADGIYMDATFGRGGHSRRILSKLNEKGRLVAVDRDLYAIAAGAEIKDSRFQLVHRAFGEIAEAAAVPPFSATAAIRCAPSTVRAARAINRGREASGVNGRITRTGSGFETSRSSPAAGKRGV